MLAECFYGIGTTGGSEATRGWGKRADELLVEVYRLE